MCNAYYIIITGHLRQAFFEDFFIFSKNTRYCTFFVFLSFTPIPSSLNCYLFINFFLFLNRYFYALFATLSLPFSIPLSLTFYIFFDHFNWSIACCNQTKTLAPEMFFPQLLPYLRKLFLKKSTACTLIYIYELTYFRIWVYAEKDAYNRRYRFVCLANKK